MSGRGKVRTSTCCVASTGSVTPAPAATSTTAVPTAATTTVLGNGRDSCDQRRR
jgi:hypothetical protein